MDGLMNKGVFITGTDTDVGKTMVSRALLEYLNTAGHKIMGVKPVCCGARDDVKLIQSENRSAGFFLSEDEVNPIDAPLLVEGAGGWAVPVTSSWGMDDLAVALNLPVIMVVSNKLGALNHSVLTAMAIEAAGLPLLGYILNTMEQSEYTHAQGTNRAVLDELLDSPCLAEIPLGGGKCSSEALRQTLEIPDLLDLPLHFQISNS